MYYRTTEVRSGNCKGSKLKKETFHPYSERQNVRPTFFHSITLTIMNRVLITLDNTSDVNNNNK